MATWDQLVCSSGNFNCNVENSRRWCGKCRFEKCLKNGMKSKFMKIHDKEGASGETNEGKGEFEMQMEDHCEASDEAWQNNVKDLAIVPAGDQGVSAVALANVCEIVSNPFDQSLNAAERFLMASRTAYTELLGIDKVCFFGNLVFFYRFY